MSEASKGWVCPVCGRGIAPAEKFCSHGHGNSFDPYAMPKIVGIDITVTTNIDRPPLKLRPQSKYQDSAELEWFVRLTQKLNVQRYLEIGSRWGDSLYAVMMNRGLGRATRIPLAMAIDIPESDEKRDSVIKTMMEIEQTVCDTFYLPSDSNSRMALDSASVKSPFDLILIDADHTYEGVRRDWDNYHKFAPVIVFHDIAAPDTWVSDGKLNGVQKFWRELTCKDTPMCSHGFKKIEEFITPRSNMGYGVIHR